MAAGAGGDVAGHVLRHRVRGRLPRPGGAPHPGGRVPAPDHGDGRVLPGVAGCRRPAPVAVPAGRRPCRPTCSPASSCSGSPPPSAAPPGGWRCDRARPAAPTAEWTALACSCLVLAVAGRADRGAARRRPRGRRHPSPWSTGSPARATGLHHVDVVVTNEGDETAANVQVSAELTIDGEATTADQTIDFLAGRRGGGARVRLRGRSRRRRAHRVGQRLRRPVAAGAFPRRAPAGAPPPLDGTAAPMARCSRSSRRSRAPEARKHWPRPRTWGHSRRSGLPCSARPVNRIGRNRKDWHDHRYREVLQCRKGFRLHLP